MERLYGEHHRKGLQKVWGEILECNPVIMDWIYELSDQKDQILKLRKWSCEYYRSKENLFYRGIEGSGGFKSTVYGSKYQSFSDCEKLGQ